MTIHLKTSPTRTPRPLIITTHLRERVYETDMGVVLIADPDNQTITIPAIMTTVRPPVVVRGFVHLVPIIAWVLTIIRDPNSPVPSTEGVTGVIGRARADTIRLRPPVAIKMT